MKEALKPILTEAGLFLEDGIYEKIEHFNALLNKVNEFTDLTSIPQEDMPIKHYADSLLILLNKNLFKSGFDIIDVGTGAGFPGMPLAIARGDINFVLLDALKKRCDFLNLVRTELDIKNIQVVHARVEDAAQGEFREIFDLSLSRAVAPMNVLLEYMLPFVKLGGSSLCWKGPQLEREIQEAENAVHILGGEFKQTIKLPIENSAHLVQVVEKIKSTPAKYPRRAGIPSKRPLK
jgi:16S rRNA (guanine527-N7)-methyltransferase